MGSEKKIVPRVTELASAPKRLVKFHILSGFEIDKSIFTRLKKLKKLLPKRPDTGGKIFSFFLDHMIRISSIFLKNFFFFLFVLFTLFEAFLMLLNHLLRYIDMNVSKHPEVCFENTFQFHNKFWWKNWWKFDKNDFEAQKW